MVESPLEMSLLFTLRLLLFYSYYDCQFSIVEFNMEWNMFIIISKATSPRQTRGHQWRSFIE